MRAKNILAFLRVALLAGLAGSGIRCSYTHPEADLPPLVYVCPMLKDADVLEEHAGKCPRCGMELKPIRIVKAYSCLNNTAFIQADPGKCKTDGTELVPITASMFWVCPSAPDKREMQSGKCEDGSDRIRKFEPRMHGDHNPRHGGQLFMVDDGWHHLEGVYPGPELFRVFFYNDWTQPLTPAGFEARVIIKESSGREMTTVLKPSHVANAMEGKIPAASLPLIASLRVRFKANEPEKVFDFTFRDYSRDPAEQPAATTQQTERPPVSKADAGAAAPAPSSASSVGQALPPENVIAAPFQPEPIPATAREILVELNARSMELAGKINQRAPMGEYWFPALRAKDLGLALVIEHLSEIPSRRRPAAENAVSRLLRVAYAIDHAGDLGDWDKIVSAHDEFVSAVNDLKSAYASIR